MFTEEDLERGGRRISEMKLGVIPRQIHLGLWLCEERLVLYCACAYGCVL